jgi:uncharacterized protein (DUF4415 family)
MNGSKTTSMTLDEMRAARAQGKSGSDFERIRREAAAGTEPAVDAASPDATALIRAAITQRRAGRPAGSGSKEQVAIRFDHDVLAAFRAEGPGWQTRMNAALREWLAQHPRRATRT